MPELPEVETTRRGISPHIRGKTVSAVIVRNPNLRWPVSRRLVTELTGQTITSVERRAKYLLLGTGKGTALVHLGMSGSLRIVDPGTTPGRHDHVDILFQDRALRLTDPRRFGSLHWTRRPPEQHRLLRDLGPEPLGPVFSGDYLYRVSRGRRVAVKQFIMNSHVVVGVGNIYANEALYMAGLNPRRAAGRIGRQSCLRLHEAIRNVLSSAIAEGGTTLRDFVNGNGEPGYFRLQLNVYGKAGAPCNRCGAEIREIRQGQRATFYCPACQK